MRILLDINVPVPLGGFLKNHEVQRASELGWESLPDGPLLRAAEDAGFDALLTCDRNVRTQQNLSGRRIALIEVSTNHWPTIRPVAAKIAAKVDFVQRGQLLLIEVDALD